MGNGVPFTKSKALVTLKITNSGLGEFFTKLEVLSSAASDTTIELAFSHTAFAQPKVSIMLESFENTGPGQDIDLDVFKYEEAIGEAVNRLGSAVYGTGAGDQPLGLEAHIDDGTNAATYGGQTRATYDPLDATVTASGGTLTLLKLATLQGNVSAAGSKTERPSIHVTTQTIWDLYETLLSPNVTASYTEIGYPAVSLRGNTVSRSMAELKGHAGFTALSYRGIPLIADEQCTSGVWYMVNERYLKWMGRTVVPNKYKGKINKVSLGGMSAMEGVSSEFLPPSDAGWFYQPDQMMPNQAGMVGRLFVIGQLVGYQPRRQGKLTGITGV